ncbi:MAG: histidine kinase [Planctomycetota bacterium]
MHREEPYMEVMAGVGIALGHVIERERSAASRKQLEQQMAELADAERQRLGRELHDTVGQECTAISMFVTTLQQQLGASSKQAEILDRLGKSSEAAKAQLRLVAKGLFPVDVDADGLRVALEDSAEMTLRTHGVACQFECPAPILLESNFVATA